MIERIWQGHTYFVMSDGTTMHDEDAPRPPVDLAAQWRREAHDDFIRDLADEAQAELLRLRRPCEGSDGGREMDDE